MIPANREAELKSAYPEGRVRLIGGLWFHLSIYFNTELPLEQFEPSRQRALRDEEIASRGTNKADKKASDLTNCIRRLLSASLSQFSTQGGTTAFDWQA